MFFISALDQLGVVTGALQERFGNHWPNERKNEKLLQVSRELPLSSGSKI